MGKGGRHVKEKLQALGAVSAALLALRFCLLPMLGQVCLALLPLFVGLAVSAAVLPLSRRIASRLGLGVRAVSLTLTLLALAALVLIGCLLLRVLALELGALADDLSGEKSPLPSLFSSISAWLTAHGIPSERVEQGLSALLSSVGTLAAPIGALASRIPSLLFLLLASSISAVYLSLWLPSAGEMLSPVLRARLSRLRGALLGGLSVYARAYATLFAVTWALSLIGLLLLRVRSPLLLALLLALVDLLPVLGVGTVLVPWAVFAALTGEGAFALCLVLLWLAVTVVRRILEDRLIGRGLGVHPLLALLSLCLGLRFFGAWGILLGPCLAAALRRLFSAARAADR